MSKLDLISALTAELSPAYYSAALIFTALNAALIGTGLLYAALILGGAV